MQHMRLHSLRVRMWIVCRSQAVFGVAFGKHSGEQDAKADLVCYTVAMQTNSPSPIPTPVLSCHAQRSIQCGAQRDTRRGTQRGRTSALHMLGALFACLSLYFFGNGSGGSVRADPETPTFPCMFDDPAGCRRQCENGNSEACYVLGRTYSDGAIVASDPALALSFYEKSCMGGSGNACNALAWRLQNTDRNQAILLYTLSCDLGSGKGCHNGALLQRTAGNSKEAKQLFRQGCQQGFAPSCRQLDAAERNQASSTPAQMIKQLQKDCAVHEKQACYDLGLTYALGDNVVKDMQQAILYFDTACQMGSSSACRDLGDALIDGKSAAVDSERALQVWQRGCTLGSAASCDHAASLLLLRKDEAAASFLYQRACLAGYGASCYQAGRLAESASKTSGVTGSTADRGQTPRSMSVAARFFYMGCGKGHRESCEAFAGMKLP